MTLIDVDKNKSIDYLKTRIKYFPICKIIEYKNSIKYNFKKNYQHISSDRQITALINISRTKRGMKIYHRLLQLLAKKIYVDDYNNFLKTILEKDANGIYKKDSQLYALLKKYKRGGFSSECDKIMIRAQLYHCIVYENILKRDKDFKLNNYLDIGCGDCKLTHKFGNMLGLSNKKIYGADISTWGSYTKEERKKLPINIIDLEEDKPLPITNNKFSYITTFMMLHHVRNLKLLLSEINRILRKGGYLMIRDHDASTYADYMLIDIEHLLYEAVERDLKNYKKYYKKYCGNYYDIIEWSYLLHLYGFEPVYISYISDSIYFEMNPTRAFIGIYKKTKNVI